MNSSRHPDMKTLAEFGLGHLSKADSEEVELHLADCEECRPGLQDIPDDALICLLRASTADTQSGPANSLGRIETDSAHEESVRCGLEQIALPFGRGELTSSVVGEISTSQTPNTDLKFALTVPKELDGHARYLVLEPLGSGGMGTVYRARHRLMERIVALKIVHPFLVTRRGAAERFTREVKAAAKLVHPNIVTAYDAERVGDLHLLVMECVEGQTLAQVLADQPELPIARACEYIRQTALGLQHALDHGMIHRDIKPQNLMLTRLGEVKILDFGLARFVREQSQSDGATEDGTLMGSPDYMAPEQERDAHAADTRADIYAMGCSLYHLLAGQVPFPATSLLAKLESHRDKPAIALCQLRADVPVELARVVAKMMAKVPARRYQVPAEVVEALRPFTQADSQPDLLRANRKPHVPLLIAVGLLLTGVGFWTATVVFRVATPQGTLIVETDDPDVQVSVKSSGTEVALIFPRQQKKISLQNGVYTLELVSGKEGSKLSTNQFEITNADDEKTVVVEFVPEFPTNQDSRSAQSDTHGGGAAADQRAAEYVLSIGGNVWVQTQDGQVIYVHDLPRESFRLTKIVLTNNQHVSDAGLSHFQGCGNLVEIGLGRTNVSDTGIANFKDSKNLTHIALDNTQVSDRGMENFRECKNLNFLYLEDTLVGDAGLAHFKSRNLGALALSRTEVTDAGLAHFQDCEQLFWLWLGDTQVGDAGVAHFRNCKGIRYLILDNTAVGDPGLAHFKDCDNLAQLWLEHTNVSDAGLAHFRNCSNLEQLHLTATKVSDSGVAHVKDCKKLKELFLDNTHVTDASLVHLKDFQNLEILKLSRTKISATGIAELKQALPNCRFE